jgi:hypothetical protein
MILSVIEAKTATKINKKNDWRVKVQRHVNCLMFELFHQDIIATLLAYCHYNTGIRIGCMPIIQSILVENKNSEDKFIRFREKYFYTIYNDDVYRGIIIKKNGIEYDYGIYIKSYNSEYNSISYKFPGFKLQYVDGSMSYMQNYYQMILKIADNIEITYNIYNLSVEFEYKVRYGDCTDIHERNYPKNTKLFRVLSRIRDKIYQRLTA